MAFNKKIRHEIAERIRGSAPEAESVLLFGSRARGDAHEDSDVDLVVLVPDGCDRRALALRARRSLWGLGLAFDLLVLTQADWQRLRGSAAWYDRELTREAQRLDDAA